MKGVTEALYISSSIISQEVTVLNCSISEKNNQTLCWRIKGCDKSFPSFLSEFAKQASGQKNLLKNQLPTNASKENYNLLPAQSMFISDEDFSSY